MVLTETHTQKQWLIKMENDGKIFNYWTPLAGGWGWTGWRLRRCGTCTARCRLTPCRWCRRRGAAATPRSRCSRTAASPTWSPRRTRAAWWGCAPRGGSAAASSSPWGQNPGPLHLSKFTTGNFIIYSTVNPSCLKKAELLSSWLKLLKVSRNNILNQKLIFKTQKLFSQLYKRLYIKYIPTFKVPLRWNFNESNLLYKRITKCITN